MTMATYLSEASMRVHSDDNLLHEKEVDETYLRLRNELSSVEIDGVSFFLAEGDLLFDEDELLFYARRRRLASLRFAERLIGNGPELGDAQTVTSGPAELMGVIRNGRPVRWDAGMLLTYCVLRRTFDSDENYRTVVAAMDEAARSWESICGVSFAHVSRLDDSADMKPDGVLYPVREISVDSTMVASAFFPTDAVFRRRMLINRLRYYTTSFDRVGVLRHELGHVLGFRHEHIRSGAPAACGDESEANTIPLTAYDPQSVMHYYCGGRGTHLFNFTENDIIGAQKLYGPPLDDTHVILPEDTETGWSDGSEDVVGFESHIKDLFRQRDRGAMRTFRNFDLWKYEDVKEHALDILREVEGGTMPCDGPWPQSSVDQFKKWVDTGMNP